MTCPERDQDLLLLDHGALPWPQMLRAKLHLSLCQDCRARFAQMAHVSTLLASEVREPTMPPWSRPQAVSRTELLPPPWHVLLALTAIVIVLGCGTLIYGRLTAPSPTSASGSTVSASGGCRPDLPNSRCR